MKAYASDEYRCAYRAYSARVFPRSVDVGDGGGATPPASTKDEARQSFESARQSRARIDPKTSHPFAIAQHHWADVRAASRRSALAPQPHIKRAGAAVARAGALEADNQRPQRDAFEPVRHLALENATLGKRIIRPRALSGDDQHQARAARLSAP